VNVTKRGDSRGLAFFRRLTRRIRAANCEKAAIRVNLCHVHRPALKRLAEVGGCRWCVEQDFQCGKGECGLDEYETRGWIGWHHHTALSMLSLWFLTLQKVRLGKKNPTHRAGSPHRAALPAATQTLGRTRNPPLVQPPAVPQRPRQTLPRRATSATTQTVTK